MSLLVDEQNRPDAQLLQTALTRCAFNTVVGEAEDCIGRGGDTMFDRICRENSPTC